jgi:hypothetical protein
VPCDPRQLIVLFRRYDGVAMTKELTSMFTDLGLELEEFIPANPRNFYLLLHLRIGPVDQDGGHDYTFGICTPDWLSHQVHVTGPLWGRHLLVVNQFAPTEIRAAIQKAVARCEREDWAETYVVLSRIFAWEFEDYQT